MSVARALLWAIESQSCRRCESGKTWSCTAGNPTKRPRESTGRVVPVRACTDAAYRLLGATKPVSHVAAASAGTEVRVRQGTVPVQHSQGTFDK